MDAGWGSDQVDPSGPVRHLPRPAARDFRSRCRGRGPDQAGPQASTSPSPTRQRVTSEPLPRSPEAGAAGCGSAGETSPPPPTPLDYYTPSLCASFTSRAIRRLLVRVAWWLPVGRGASARSPGRHARSRPWPERGRPERRAQPRRPRRAATARAGSVPRQRCAPRAGGPAAERPLDAPRAPDRSRGHHNPGLPSRCSGEAFDGGAPGAQRGPRALRQPVPGGRAPGAGEPPGSGVRAMAAGASRGGMAYGHGQHPGARPEAMRCRRRPCLITHSRFIDSLSLHILTNMCKLLHSWSDTPRRNP